MHDNQLPARRLIIGLASFAALSAIGGSIELLAWPDGNRYVPIEALGYSPFKSFLIPGLLLGIVVGGTNLACAVLVWRRVRAALDATLLAGGALTVWIVAEVGMMRVVHWLHVIYGALGAAILTLGVRAAWRAGLSRYRWVILVTLAEAVGFMAPALAGILSAKARLPDLAQSSLVVTAGFVEGFVLGSGQAWAFPFPVRRLRFALLTALGAGIVWFTVMSMMHLARRGDQPITIMAIAGVVTTLVGLAAIGSAQWTELHHHIKGARGWILC